VRKTGQQPVRTNFVSETAGCDERFDGSAVREMSSGTDRDARDIRRNAHTAWYTPDSVNRVARTGFRTRVYR